jgi:hypothetical protein
VFTPEGDVRESARRMRPESNQPRGMKKRKKVEDEMRRKREKDEGETEKKVEVRVGGENG